MRHKTTGNRKFICSVLSVMLLALSFTAEAQQPAKVPRIGFLITNSRAALLARTEAFQHGLRELGYIEGKNILIEWRSADGKVDRLLELAAELVRLKVDVIVTGGATATRPAKEATATIPIVMAQDGDPVGAGLIASQARPGGNITGLSSLAPELSGKRMQLLKETVPKISRVAVLWYLDLPIAALHLNHTEDAARELGLQIQSLGVRVPNEIESAFSRLSKGRADAIVVLPGAVIFGYRTRIVELAAKSRMPAIYADREFTLAGGLMSYTTSIPDLYRRAAYYVDKILKGTKPADLPVETPMKFELVINLKTAKQIGLTIPDSVLYRVDRVIK
jgi:putative tryptophan/tyrosine transport system substrate-binding protein